MSSDDPYIFKNKKGEFVLKGDSIDLIYSFSGENAPITVGINNLKTTPIYIDWRKSGLIVDDNTITFREPINVFASYGDTSSTNYGRYLNDPIGISTIKSGSRKNTQILELTNFNFQQIPKDQFVTNKNRSKNKYISYREDNSPIYLETFVTVYEKSNDLNNFFIFETNFYMSQLEKVETKSANNPLENTDLRGDLFYVKDEEVKIEKTKKTGGQTKPSTIKNLNKVVKSISDNIKEWVLDGRDE